MGLRENKAIAERIDNAHFASAPRLFLDSGARVTVVARIEMIAKP